MSSQNIQFCLIELRGGLAVDATVTGRHLEDVHENIQVIQTLAALYQEIVQLLSHVHDQAQWSHVDYLLALLHFYSTNLFLPVDNTGGVDIMLSCKHGALTPRPRPGSD